MLDNEDGADFLPMRLVAILIVSSLILATVATYALEVVGQWSKASARACASRIVAVAEAEYSDAAGGGAHFTVTVPDSVINMTFGRVTANFQTGASGEYSVRYADGSGEVHVSGVPFGSGNEEPGRGEPVVLYPGRYSIRIATEEVGDMAMALIYSEAA
jgi:hypothetical protein